MSQFAQRMQRLLQAMKDPKKRWKTPNPMTEVMKQRSGYAKLSASHDTMSKLSSRYPS